MPVLKYRDPNTGQFYELIGSGGGADEVTISSVQPTDPKNELWVNINEDTPPNDWSGADDRFINADGDTMEAPLHLPAAAPAAATEATHKGYVDSRIWFGTQAQYNAITTKDPTVLYCISG